MSFAKTHTRILLAPGIWPWASNIAISLDLREPDMGAKLAVTSKLRLKCQQKTEKPELE